MFGHYYVLSVSEVPLELKDKVEEILRTTGSQNPVLEQSNYSSFGLEFKEEIMALESGEVYELEALFEELGAEVQHSEGGESYLDDDCAYTEDEYDALGGMVTPESLYVWFNDKKK